MDYLEHKLSKLDELISDPTMIEIAINPDGSVWSLRRGETAMTVVDVTYTSPDAYQLSNLIASKANITTGKDKLLISAAVRYKERVLRAQVVMDPAAAGASAISLRLFSSFSIDDVTVDYLNGRSSSGNKVRQENLASLQKLVLNGDNLVDILNLCVMQRLNILVSGGTDSGKTVLLRKIVSLIRSDDRLITIEDAQELFPTQPNTVALIADRNSSHRSTDQLLEATLRMRPDRIILGEIRGKEAMTFLEAINTGHGGSMSTIHAETPELALDRLAIAALRSGIPMTYDNMVGYITRTIDVIIQTGRLGSKRGVLEVFCVQGKAL